MLKNKIIQHKITALFEDITIKSMNIEYILWKLKKENINKEDSFFAIESLLNQNYITSFFLHKEKFYSLNKKRKFNITESSNLECL